MIVLREVGYNRAQAVNYAHKWAYGRNPKFTNFANDGGDCTNFASQVLYAGCGVMNVKPDGWYYKSANDRAPAWTSVEHLYRFLTNNQGAGPYAEEGDLLTVEPGDLLQLRFEYGDRFAHTLVVVGSGGSADEILVAAHTFNCDNRKLSSYMYADVRALKILGARK